MGELKKSPEKHKQSFEMRRAIYGPNKPHPDIASCLNYLGNVYYSMSIVENALEKHKQSLEMRRAIHGPNNPHPDIGSSLGNLGLVYQEMSELGMLWRNTNRA